MDDNQLAGIQIAMSHLAFPLLGSIIGLFFKDPFGGGAVGWTVSVFAVARLLCRGPIHSDLFRF